MTIKDSIREHNNWLMPGLLILVAWYIFNNNEILGYTPNKLWVVGGLAAAYYIFHCLKDDMVQLQNAKVIEQVQPQQPAPIQQQFKSAEFSSNKPFDFDVDGVHRR